MGNFDVLIKGALKCDDKDWVAHVLREPRGWTLDAADTNRATLELDMKHLGGEWKMTLAAIRTCPGH